MLEIVRAKLADVADLHPLVEKYRAFYKQPENEKTLGYLKSRLENDEAIVFIARENAEAVGFTMLYPTFSTVSLSAVWLFFLINSSLSNLSIEKYPNIFSKVTNDLTFEYLFVLKSSCLNWKS
jgi:hypothetical protein